MNTPIQTESLKILSIDEHTNDPLFEEPGKLQGWDLDGDPDVMCEKALCAAAARDLLGCKVKWSPKDGDWTCGCDDSAHLDAEYGVLMDGEALREEVLKVSSSRVLRL